MRKEWRERIEEKQIKSQICEWHYHTSSKNVDWFWVSTNVWKWLVLLSFPKKKKKKFLLSCKIPQTNLLYFYEIFHWWPISNQAEGGFWLFGFLVRVGLVRSNGYLASAFIPSKIIIINEILIKIKFRYSSLGQVH